MPGVEAGSAGGESRRSPAQQSTGEPAETRNRSPGSQIAPVVDIVVPVYNEEADLESSVRRLRAYLDDRFPFASAITIADNASTDSTWAIAWKLADSMPGVRAIHLDEKGRGRALRQAWLASEATIVAYMDVDLSTDLDALLPLVAPCCPATARSPSAAGSPAGRGSRAARSAS